MRLLALALLVAGCASAAPSAPSDVLSAYGRAVEAGDYQKAYALLSDEARQELGFEAFQRMLKDNPAEARALARSLSAPSGPPLVTATVTAPNGEVLELVFERGEWRVDAPALDLYSQASPKAAVTAFVRAYRNKRWDVLLRFVPKSQAEGLSAQQLQQQWQGEQKEEIERLVQALEAALPTAKLELLGERATLGYGVGSTVELVREEGRWKIEDFQ